MQASGPKQDVTQVDVVLRKELRKLDSAECKAYEIALVFSGDQVGTSQRSLL